MGMTVGKNEPATLIHHVDDPVNYCEKRCPFHKITGTGSTDGFDRGEDWHCTKANKPIMGFVEWTDKVCIPEWCPLRIENQTKESESDMLTAKEAREKTLKNKEETERTEMNSLENLINEAIDNHEFEIWVDSVCCNNKAKLIDAGYIIKMESGVHISWKA